MKWAKALNFLTPLIILGGWELFFFFPRLVCFCLFFNVFLISFTIFYFYKHSQDNKKWLFNFLIFPVLFQISLLCYSLITSSYFFVHLLFFINFLLLYFYLRYCFLFFLCPQLYQKGSIENISSFGNFFLFFLLASSLYGFESFLNISVWILSLIMLVIIFFVIYQVFWANYINIIKYFLYICLFCLILIELFWSLLFLPFNYNVLGAILAFCYYVLIGIGRHYLLHRLNRQLIKLYLLVGFLSIFIIILTTRWM